MIRIPINNGPSLAALQWAGRWRATSLRLSTARQTAIP
jgi:hypothetical protein